MKTSLSCTVLHPAHAFRQPLLSEGGGRQKSGLFTRELLTENFEARNIL
jgi:hypothetical protein